jgi:polyferredoxin
LLTIAPVTLFAAWSERQAHAVRWALLMGWLLLLVSLILPQGAWLGGTRLFWGTIVPAGLLILVVASHELWRRICPLAFASQLFRALGLQRTVAGRKGQPVLAKVEPDSWLARNHVALQWGLLIAGLVLRLLAANSDRLVLAVLIAVTLLTAVAVGWAWSGKAWCQYFCPMGPVQTVITGPRSLFGSAAHLGSGARLTQSMCRTVGTDGQVKSACVACQSPCIDIDSERGYWQSLGERAQLAWAWHSYPGLVLSFFLLLHGLAALPPEQMAQGLWALEPDLTSRLLDPWPRGGALLSLPRLLVVPLLLLLGAWLSVVLFRGVERLLRLQLRRRAGLSQERVRELACQRTRLLATFTAVNLFFGLTDLTLHLGGGLGGAAIRVLALSVSAMWLYRGWGRDSAVYKRESTSVSLRSQLVKRYPNILQYLDGRSPEDLSASEVFTLAKVLPGHDRELSLTLYRDVLADLFRHGRAERDSAFAQFQELRSCLALQDSDHHRVMRELAQLDPPLLAMEPAQLAIRNLRLQAASEAMAEFLRLERLDALRPSELSPAQRDRLAAIRRDCSLDEELWQQLLAKHGPHSSFGRQRVRLSFEALCADFGRRRALELEGDRTPMLRPLLQVLDHRLADGVVALLPLLQEFSPEDPLWSDFAALQKRLPLRVLAELEWRERSFPPWPRA